MPRYDFECDAGHTTERTFSFADVPKLIACPANIAGYCPACVGVGSHSCGKPAERQISGGTWFINNKVMAAPSVRKAHSNISDL